jgi:hypothetical protein
MVGDLKILYAAYATELLSDGNLDDEKVVLRVFASSFLNLCCF